MKYINKYLPFILFIFLFTQTNCQKIKEMDIKTINTVEINKYLGKWYEIARMPFKFEDGLMNTTATYSLRKDGKIEVLNEGYEGSPNGKYHKAVGKAWIPNTAEKGKLKVSFFWPFSANYWIVALDEKDYQYALVISSSKYAWILCRKPWIEPQLYDSLKKVAGQNGVDFSKMIKVAHSWK